MVGIGRENGGEKLKFIKRILNKIIKNTQHILFVIFLLFLRPPSPPPPAPPPSPPPPTSPTSCLVLLILFVSKPLFFTQMFLKNDKHK